MKKISFTVTKANRWSMVGFYGCLFLSISSIFLFGYSFYEPSILKLEGWKAEYFWRATYLICAWICFQRGKVFNLDAQAKDKLQAYEDAPEDTDEQRERKQQLWDEYKDLSHEASKLLISFFWV